ncbi:hypothetical protein [Pseudomonas sp. PONIH3]|uniref:hypothetical protein n=1 Tax=Pseudomonas sp. PONIH3 TaxID=1636610 RepID=UPI000CDC424A|nr:hypothetical protein [Pseudomonas sp. PONIH3]AUY33347.1 hypothetical protein C3F42_09040 [Pseudomonas sp. PONIH3]
MYEKLVDNPDDIVGQLAYCMYKQSKQQYLQQFASRNNRQPTDAEVRNHVHCAELPSVDMYKDTANNLFNEYLGQAVQEKLDEMEKHYKAELWLFIKRHKPETYGERFSHGLKALLFGGVGGVVGNALTTLLVIIFLFGAASSVTRDDFSKSSRERLISGLAETFDVGITINGNPKGEPAIEAASVTTPATPRP